MSGSAELNGKDPWQFIGNYQTVFQTGYIVLKSHQQCMEFQLLHILCQHWFYLVSTGPILSEFDDSSL